MDLSRMYTLVGQLVHEDEKGHGITVYGTVLRPSWGIRELSAATASDARDILLFSNRRFLVVLSKPTSQLKLRDAFKAARGNVSGVCGTQEFTRGVVTGYCVDTAAPETIRLAGDIRWLHLDVEDRDGPSQIHMLMDEISRPQPDLEQRLDDYLAGAQL